MRTQEMEELPMLAMPQPFITLIQNERHARVEVHLRGEFKSPQECTQQLSELYQLSEQYAVCCVFINSNGGRIDLLMEIVNVLKKFDCVITIVTSNAASAGLMLWSIGHIRVVCPHAELMAHRETSGYIDKTDALIDRAAFLKRRFDALFVDLCEGVLLPDEMDKARSGEVWLLGEDMIERGAAISWEQFHTLDTQPVEPMHIFHRNGKLYLESNGALLPVNLEVNEDEVYNLWEVMYNIPSSQINSSFLDDDEEDVILKEAFEEGEASCTEESLEKEESEFFSNEDELRNYLRMIFGKGNHRIKFMEEIDGWGIDVKVDGRWFELLKEDDCLFEEFVVMPVDDLDEMIEWLFKRIGKGFLG